MYECMENKPSFKCVNISVCVHLLCRKQDYPPKLHGPQQSHLMDLLDISLGATSISGPSQASDPWGMPDQPKHVSIQCQMKIAFFL